VAGSKPRGFGDRALGSPSEPKGDSGWKSVTDGDDPLTVLRRWHWTRPNPDEPTTASIRHSYMRRVVPSITDFYPARPRNGQVTGSLGDCGLSRVALHFPPEDFLNRQALHSSPLTTRNGA
jgi:hypothetical protein